MLHRYISTVLMAFLALGITIQKGFSEELSVDDSVLTSAHGRTVKEGLKFQDLVQGSGITAAKGNEVTVHYSGFLYSTGELFDSSLNRGTPFRFKLGAGRVIKGWEEGVKGMRVGGKRRLVIPPALGYGSQGIAGIIPPNATLQFDVELLDVQ
jgi:FKBP-type peptidyl-prolyl cis-trans isomerase